MGSNEPIKLKIEDRIAHLILDKPPENRMDKAFLQHMSKAIYTLIKSEDVGAVVVYGSGRHFSAGADVDYVKNSVLEPHESGNEFDKIAMEKIFSPSQALRDLESFHVPVIAAINGLCMGSGLELALACDIRICGTNAIMGSPELSWGIITGLGGSFRLERLLGRSRAMEMLLRGEIITGQEACNIGLANKCTDRKEVLPRAMSLAKFLAQSDRREFNADAKRLLPAL